MIAKNAVPPLMVKPDFTLNIKRGGSPLNPKFDFQWLNLGGFSRDELCAVFRSAADYFEGIDRAEAARIYGATNPRFRPRPIA